VRNKLRLRAEECFQERAGHSRVTPVMFEVLDTTFLVGDVLLSTQYVTLSLFEMLKLAGPIHLLSSHLGGSAIGLSATDAYGPSRCR
jgi:hypothetical protein